MAVLNSKTTGSSVCQNQYAEDEKKTQYAVMAIWNSETIGAMEAPAGTEPAFTPTCENEYAEGEKKIHYTVYCLEFGNIGAMQGPVGTRPTRPLLATKSI